MRGTNCNCIPNSSGNLVTMQLNNRSLNILAFSSDLPDKWFMIYHFGNGFGP